MTTVTIFRRRYRVMRGMGEREREREREEDRIRYPRYRYGVGVCASAAGSLEWRDWRASGRTNTHAHMRGRAFARSRFLSGYRVYVPARWCMLYSFMCRSSSLFPSERTAGLRVDRVEGSKKRQKRRLSGELWSKGKTRGSKERVSARVCRSVRSTRLDRGRERDT